MQDVKIIDYTYLKKYQSLNEGKIDLLLRDELKNLKKKIVVLDDDPTGVQTVHGISVYTDWETDTLQGAFESNDNMFFILTNSRGMTQSETIAAHNDIADNIITAAHKTNKDFLIISRSDSTLRGHYPQETMVLKDIIESKYDVKFDGEVIIPFFTEGGRLTINNIHYVKEGDKLIPAGMTEFAKDKTFGYENSHLGFWANEKTNDEYNPDDMIYITLDDIRCMNLNKIEDQLLGAENFNKIIVNAIEYADVKVFCIALLRAMKNGKDFIFRSAAGFTKVIGNIADKKLLSKEEIISDDNTNGGIVLVGSHVNKTTLQLNTLKSSEHKMNFIEFVVKTALQDDGLKMEAERVQSIVDEKIAKGETVVVYTSREKLELDIDNKDEYLKAQVRISNAVTSIIGNLSQKPSFIIAKGGITSSDVGVKALKVKKALVLGQIMPGIPVWLTGDESKFPNMPYIIFPGNVGQEDTLKTMVEKLVSG